MKNSAQLIKRSRRNFKKIATTVEIRENGEELIKRAVIEQLGLECRPFWEEVDDLEGRCYNAYISSHPDFDICLRASVAHRLAHAQSLLPKTWNFVIKAGFRPTSVQIALLDSLIQDVKKRNRGLNNEQALMHARAFVADPRIECPPHTTGGAVDIDVIDINTKKPIAMGCPPNTDDERAALHSPAITKEEYDNRLVLLNAMLVAGFAPHHNEWWHYSYGDTRWAVFYEAHYAHYGIISESI